MQFVDRGKDAFSIGFKGLKTIKTDVAMGRWPYSLKTGLRGLNAGC